VRGDVDHADDGVVLLGGDDVLAVRGEERVVGHLEGLAPGQVTGLRELPPDTALRVDDQEPVVVVVGDQHVTRQGGRIGVRRQVAPAVGRAEPRRAGQRGLAGAAA
jgi:hypothetical protein